MGGRIYSIKFPGREYADERDYPTVHGILASPGYFSVLRGAVIEGRTFDTRDHAGAEPSVIVNRALATKYFPSGAIGQRLALANGSHQEWRTIVGVAPNFGMGLAAADTVAEGIYLPLMQMPPTGFMILVQAAGAPLAITAPVRDALRALDANLPIYNVNTAARAIYAQNWAFRVFGSLFMSFGFAALFLATVGLYGVMAFSVSRRTQEIGVRMAMGASRGEVLGLILRQGMMQVGIGTALGIGLGVGLGSAIKILLFQVTAYDPVVFTVIAAVMVLTGLLACLVPARRAAGVDPMEALRYQ